MRVVLQDAGDKREKDLEFCPAQDAESQTVAKENAAVMVQFFYTLFDTM